MVPFSAKYMTSNSWLFVIFALSLTAYEIFANQLKFQKFEFENEGQEEKNRTCAVRLEMFDFSFFSKFQLPGNIILCKS